MAKRPNLKKLQAEVDRFNEECPVGTIVTVEKDNGEKVESLVRLPATILGGHTAVGWFEGISGCYLLDRAKKA